MPQKLRLTSVKLFQVLLQLKSIVWQQRFREAECNAFNLWFSAKVVPPIDLTNKGFE